VTPVQRYLERFIRKSDIQAHGKLLDVGCGDGRLTAKLAMMADQAIGIDVNAHASWAELSSERLMFRIGNAHALPFEDASFDVVVAVNMLHHADDPAKVLSEAFRVCAPGGKLIVAEPNRWNPLGYVHLTLLGRHEHFRTTKFLELLRSVNESFELRQFECHCYPVPAGIAIWLERAEDLLDRATCWRPLAFYNVATVYRNG
jgi:ubiquinone/menaquinone biosynthesis C-methylase UbiE